MHTLLRGNVILLLLGDVVIFIGALILTLAFRYQEMPSQEIVDQHLGPFLFLFALWTLVYWIAGLYDRRLFFARKRITGLVFQTQFINVLIAGVFFFAFPLGIEPKTNLAIYLGVSTALIVCWRLYVFPLFMTSAVAQMLVIGDSVEAKEIVTLFTRSPYFKNIAATGMATSGRDLKTLREDLVSAVAGRQVDMIIADTRDRNVAALTQDFYTLVFTDREIKFFSLPVMYEQLFHRIPPALVADTWFLENTSTQAPHYAYDFLKRGVDIVGALVLSVPALIVAPVVALAIRLESAGPILYRAERTGQFNRTIMLTKFRTKNGTDSAAEALNSTLVDTRVGVFLRATRLDELPQLWNIFRGDLSFIGPRPEIPSLAAVYAEEIPYYSLRHLIKPGLSGWAQILHYDAPRSRVDTERTREKLAYDLYYLKHRSFFLDVEIAVKTIKTLLLRTGR